MFRKWPLALAVLLALGLLALFFGAVVTRARDNLPVVQIGEGPEPPRREANAPDISFIDSQNPTCQLPTPGTGVCYINWGYLYVTATSPQYIISMTVSINGNIQAYNSGFFQTYMYIPGDFYAPGFRVTCGLPGASGVPGRGNSYSYTIRARETGGLSAANYGSVTCPADVVRVFIPVAKK